MLTVRWVGFMRLVLRPLGFDPARLLLMRAQTVETALRAAGEAVRCAGLGAVLMSVWGETRLFDLTASRRLLLAAETSGVPLLIIRTAARPQPGAVATRWQVRGYFLSGDGSQRSRPSRFRGHAHAPARWSIGSGVASGVEP